MKTLNAESISLIAESAQGIADVVGNKPGIKEKLQSRKLWISVAGLLTGIFGMIGFSDNTVAIISFVILDVVSVIIYCVAEGMIDAARAKQLSEAVNKLGELINTVNTTKPETSVEASETNTDAE